MRVWTDDPASVRPMLATTGDAPLESSALAYEPKYDGVRALVSVVPGRPPSVRFWSRLGNEKTSQFPEIAEALRAWARRLDRPVMLDGEIVAIGPDGSPVGFQHLQRRIHLKAPSPAAGASTALIVFDLLRDGQEDLRPLPLRERRARLEALMRGVTDSRLRLSEQAVGDGRALLERAQSLGWEGLIAKRLDSPYTSGRRSSDWIKLKLVRRQACVVGGWTEPRGSRPFFGALLLGVYDRDGRLQYVGHVGTGFSDAELRRIWTLLQPLETTSCPFAAAPKTNERPHWVKPQLVVEVKFTEWTADGRLRHPTYIGLRDDMDPSRVRKEPDQVVRPMAGAPGHPRRAAFPSPASPTRGRAAERTGASSAASSGGGSGLPPAAVTAALLRQLEAIPAGDGVLEVPGEGWLEVTNLQKVYFPDLNLTKGDLFRHYVRVAPVILPVLADRPLVMKRHPHGIGGRPFFQHRAPDRVPPGVRVMTMDIGAEKRAYLVGGNLLTLLYTVQLGSISQDPWFSRVQSPDDIDYAAIDLDPPDGLAFARVLDVARWVRDELDSLGAVSVPKTSGARGLHIYIPMPPRTSYEAGLLFCQIVATIVANKHPRQATIERSVAARGRRVYLDCLQNIKGKTLASAYSARANEFAGVSTPLTWGEVEAGGLSPRDFTIVNFPERLKQVGDLWAALRKAKGVDLRAVAKYIET